MNIAYSSVANPAYANKEKTLITCDVVFPHLGPAAVQFTASVNGLPHERAIFAECDSGMHGPVRAYTRDAGVAINEITRIRDAKLSAGYQDAVTGKTWQCDDSSIGKWTAMAASTGMAVIAQQTPVPQFYLIAADNSVVTLTAPEVFALFNQRVMPWVAATMLYARQLKDQAIMGTAPADLEQGWP